MNITQTPFYWWWRMMENHYFELNVWKEFWYYINIGYHDMEFDCYVKTLKVVS